MLTIQILLSYLKVRIALLKSLGSSIIRHFIAQGTAVLGIGKIAGRQRIEDTGRTHDFLIAVLRGRPEIFESLAVRLPRRLFPQIWDVHILRYHLPRHDEPMELVFVDDRNGEIHQSIPHDSGMGSKHGS